MDFTLHKVISRKKSYHDCELFNNYDCELSDYHGQEVLDKQERELFLSLYNDFKGLMYKTSYSILRDRESAMDITHDACEALMRKISVIRKLERNRLPSYIVSTVRNISLNYIKKRDRANKHMFLDAGDILNNCVSDEELEASYIKKEQAKELAEALGKLSNRDREVIRLKYFEERSDNEIALRFGIKTDSVRPALMRAKQHLREVVIRGE
jgi:RNA polymerase sigma-70 factor (ECF subfamily)